MKQLDQYILKQLFGPFVFFMIVFIGLLWLNRALGLVDVVVENGQPASIFVELAINLLPKTIEAAIPIAGFAASVMVTNRLFSEAELVVMMNAGRSVVSLAFPYFMFGLICCLTMSLVVHYLAPFATKRLADRQEEIGRQYVTQIVKEGEFVSNDGRFTFFFGEKGADGTLRDIMISEQVSKNKIVTHVAQKGQAVTQDGTTKLLLFNGSIQDFTLNDVALNVIQFGSLSYDLSQFETAIKTRVTRPDELFTSDLYDYIEARTLDVKNQAGAVAILHDRFVKPLLSLLTPVIGMATLLVGGFSRSGFILRIIVSIVLMFSIDTFRGVSQSWVSSDGAHWIVSYAPVALAVIVLIVLLFLGSNDLKSVRAQMFGARRQVAP
ncbi:LPS export ABC transporter permease LptF [Amylibacter ulvae]|uniref:LPS export ABC transporter permease LptF n=1 Tax=Paramylibacter ulvae TaxID=1651968 RepID=A0ABQ3CV16_9RHOB|nr:LptF/LptG family permease [Amylibacter ulvae]GHA40407.1 LPS export ABC transporter permease LptF [Amylibacter ulvae]